MQCKTCLSLKKCLRADYFEIFHYMQYDMVLVTNTNTLHVRIMCKNYSIFPPTWLGGEHTTERVGERSLYFLYIISMCILLVFNNNKHLTFRHCASCI